MNSSFLFTSTSVNVDLDSNISNIIFNIVKSIETSVNAFFKKLLLIIIIIIIICVNLLARETRYSLKT